MEREKRYIKLEQREFFSITNEFKEEILYNKPLYEIIVARIKRFIKRFKWKMIVRKAIRKIAK